MAMPVPDRLSARGKVRTNLAPSPTRASSSAAAARLAVTPRTSWARAAPPSSEGAASPDCQNGPKSREWRSTRVSPGSCGPPSGVLRPVDES